MNHSFELVLFSELVKWLCTMAEINSQFDHFLTESFEAVSQSSQYDSTRICQNTEQIEHDQLKQNYTF